jgi:pyruvate dehydrogenase E1 component beta subunit
MLAYREAIAAALAAELERDSSVVVLGEDVVLGGVWVTTPGLAERFPGRVIDTPISELAFTSAAFGAAVRGLRPTSSGSSRTRSSTRRPSTGTCPTDRRACP